jgi:hypothetical protein
MLNYHGGFEMCPPLFKFLTIILVVSVSQQIYGMEKEDNTQTNIATSTTAKTPIMGSRENTTLCDNNVELKELKPKNIEIKSDLVVQESNSVNNSAGEQKSKDGYAALLLNTAIQNEKDLPNVATHQHQELADNGFYDETSEIQKPKDNKKNEQESTDIGKKGSRTRSYASSKSNNPGAQAKSAIQPTAINNSLPTNNNTASNNPSAQAKPATQPPDMPKLVKKTFINVTTGEEKVGFQFVDKDNNSLHSKKDPFLDISTLKMHLASTKLIYQDVIENILENAYLSLRLSLDLHINQNIIKILLKNYMDDESNLSDKISVTGSSMDETEILKKYMNVCSAIYTDSNTRSFLVEQKLLNVEKKLNTIIYNKKTFDELSKNIHDFYNIHNELIYKNPIYIREGAKTHLSEQIRSIEEDTWKEKFKNFSEYVDKVNSFLKTINKKSIEINVKEQFKDTVMFVLNRLNDINLSLNDDYLFYFEKDEDKKESLIFDKNFELSKSFTIPKFKGDGIDRQLTAKAVISFSFLMKAGLLGDDNVTIIDIGFRHKELVGTYLNNFARGLMKAKSNPEAWFQNHGEVDYIAYIEKVPNCKKDNLVIVYSGSNSQEDWASNFTLGSRWFLGLSTHEGFNWLFSKSSNTFHSILKERIINYYKNSVNPPEKLDIIVTGHSLGGALAELAAYYYATEQIKEFKKVKEFEKIEISVKAYTFGAPAIFDKSSKEVIEDENALKRENIYRVWTSDDIVVNWTDETIPQRGVHIGKSFPLYNIQNLSTKFFDWWGPHGADYYLSLLHALKDDNLSSTYKKFTNTLNDYISSTRLGIYKRNLKMLETILRSDFDNVYYLPLELAKHIIKYSPTISDLSPNVPIKDILENYFNSFEDIRYASAWPVTFIPTSNSPNNPNIEAIFQIHDRKLYFKINENTNCTTVRIQEFLKEKRIFLDKRPAEELSCACFVAKYTLVSSSVQTLAQIFSNCIKRKAASTEYLQEIRKGKTELETALEIMKKVGLSKQLEDKIVHLCNLKPRINEIHKANYKKIDKVKFDDNIINDILNNTNDICNKYDKIFDQIIKTICHSQVDIEGIKITTEEEREKFERLDTIFDKHLLKENFEDNLNNYGIFKTNLLQILRRYYETYWFRDDKSIELFGKLNLPLYTGRLNFTKNMTILDNYLIELEKFIVEKEQEWK